MSRIRFGLVACCLLAGMWSAQGQQRAGTELPVSRLVLFSSGVGYFQRDGLVEGNSKIDLQFHTQDINDLLKSLILQDANGGHVSTVNYDNRDPIDKTLKSFAIDLTQNPSIGQLLNQVRGERVEVVSVNEKGNPVTITGQVVGVEKVHRPAGKDQVIEMEQANLLTDQGMESVLLSQVQRIKFLKPELENEFRKALRVLATGHDNQKKTVTLNFQGNGKRQVRVGYVTESPVWKTSYRLSLDKEGTKDKAHLQGWAIVENTTDEDWNNVSLGLVSGRPISFRMDLYEPLFIPRPQVQLELFSSLRPQTYGGDVFFKQMAGAAPTNRAAGEGAPGGKAARDAMVLRSLNDAERESPPGAPLAAPASGASIDFRQGVASAAIATELGEFFKYEIEQPVNLARQKSALLPIVNGPVEAANVSIYNEGVHAKFPLLGLRLKNTTGLHLMQGPITVFEAGSYAGDARATDLQPNESRLISYAVDLGTEVVPTSPQASEEIVAVKIVRGIMHVTHKSRSTRRYALKNRSDHSRLVLVEHPIRPNWTLLTPTKPAEQSRDVYRFEVPLESRKSSSLDVVEEMKRFESIALSSQPDQSVRLFLRQSVLSPQVKEALEKAMQLKAEVAKSQLELDRENQALRVIESDQGRMRSNMQRVPPTSEAYKRYLKKFDDQETEIEKRREHVTRLQATVDGQQKTFDDFVANLNVE